MINVIIQFKSAVKLQCFVADNLPPVIEMDPQRLKQILINLLKNATKFTFKGVIRLRLSKAKLLVTKQRRPIGHQDAIFFEVYDTGLGISKANMRSLFQLFGKLKQSDHTVNREGCGLGLYIVKKMVTQMNGTISINSEEGEWTRFALTLPVAQQFKRMDTDLGSMFELIDTSTFQLEDVEGAEVYAMTERVFWKASRSSSFVPS